MAKSTESKELVPIQADNLPAELRDEIMADYENSLNEMMDGIDARAQKIKISPGGSNNWLIGAEEEAKKSFRGVIIINVKANAYWHKKNKPNPIELDSLDPDRNDEIPVCSAIGGEHAGEKELIGSREQEFIEVNGEPKPCFGKCSECYLNDFGTGISESGQLTKGKACKNGRRMLLYIEGSDIPYVLLLPPTSIRPFDDYITTLKGKRLATWAVWTTFNLESRSEGEKKWSIFKPGDWTKLSDADIAAAYMFRKQFKTLVGIEITEDEFVGTTNGESSETDTTDEGNDDLPF